tara:strand:+ start:152 stop:487 length:336 start_codon:yes stop_codon:yes gene_type:complete
MVIARTGFYVSTISYLVFLLADLIKPGFVSNYMSVHWFLLAAIVFAIWWGSRLESVRQRVSVQYAVSVLFGLIAAILVWKAGVDLEEFRILTVILAFALPSIILGVLRSDR